MTQLILYTTEDSRSQIKLRAQERTVWLTRLDSAATVKESLSVQTGFNRPATTEKCSAVQKERI